jgi:hypothetical protein
MGRNGRERKVLSPSNTAAINAPSGFEIATKMTSTAKIWEILDHVIEAEPEQC